MKKHEFNSVFNRWEDEKFRRRVEEARRGKPKNQSSEELSDMDRRGIKLKTDWRSLR